MGVLTKKAYESLILADLRWLDAALLAYKEKYPESNLGQMERDHIVMLLEWSVDKFYMRGGVCDEK